MGVTLALPLLDSMIPARTALAQTAATPRSRFCGIYVPHGATMDKWTPAEEGSGFEFPESLKPLEKLRDRVCVVSNLAHPAGERRRLGRGRGSRAFCRGVPERRAPRERLGARRDDAGPGAGRPHRSGHAAAVDRTGDRGSRLELRLGLRLRVLQHHLLAHAHAAAADGEQPAGRLRAPVRRRHQRGAAPGAEAAGPQHSRFDHRQGRAAAAARSIRATARASASISTISGKSSGAFRRPRSSRRAS